MIFKSIRWRLQVWYGVILLVVLAGFGLTAYQLERNRIFRRADEQLQHHAGALMLLFRHPPEGRAHDPQPRQEFPPPGWHPDDWSFDQPGSHFTLPPRLAGLFETNNPGNFYFVIHDSQGREAARGGNVPAEEPQETADNSDVPPPPTSTHHQPPGPGPEHAPQPVIFHENRVLIQRLPSGGSLIVGCSVQPEISELKMTALTLTGFGAFVLLLGLTGGGWFIGRALRPVSAISTTATKIAAGDLSQRINAAETESELGQLAAVLNSTFARLETAFEQQKRFAADAAHELRTPVSVMLTQTQTALARERDAAAYRQTLEACQRAAQRMRRLIESLLELARFDAGQEVLKQLDLDLAHTVADAVDLIQPLAAERRVKILPELQPLAITGDPERLSQVVTNLLTNAIQFNRPEGEVRIRLTGQNGLAVLEITDTGSGIAPEDLPRIFDRFYRADKSRTGAGNSGLGLAICRAIVEAHGGTIEAASENRAGTTFIVRLPMKI